MNYNARRVILRLASKLCEVLPVFFWGFLIFGFEESEVAVITILCAIIHECGHLLCILLQSGKINLRGAISGFRINTSRIKSYGQEIAIYLCGPLANLISALVLSLPLVSRSDFSETASLLNIATAISNLLPIKGYDGYGILRAVIMRSGSHDKLLYLLERVSSSLIFLLCIFSLYLIDRQGGGYWIFALFFFSMIKSIRDDLGE